MLLDRTIRLYTDNVGLMIGIAAIANAPYLLIQLGIALALPTLTAPLAQGASLDESTIVAMLTSAAVSFIVLMIWALIAVPLSLAATTKAVSELYLGNNVTIGQTFHTAWGVLWKVLTSQFVAGLVVMVGIMLFIVPGILWSLSYAVLMPVIVIEALRGRESRQRSWNLVSGNRGRVFNVFALLLLLRLVLAAGVGALSQVVGSAMLDTALNAALTIALAPIGAIAMTLVYYDLRIRKEGFDMDMLRKQLETAG
jgi:hypothetical protein